MPIDSPKFVLRLLNNYRGMIDSMTLCDLIQAGATEEVEPGAFEVGARRIVCDWSQPQDQRTGLYGWSWKFESNA